MSKTSEENLARIALERYWKRYAGSATEWLRRYQTDPFYRTEVNVILLQVAFAAIVIIVFSASYQINSESVSSAISSSINACRVPASIPEMGPSILSRVQDTRQQNYLFAISLIGIVTIAFGYVIARVTLAPARNALAAQKQFIGNIAHELRTPLAIIKTNTEIGLLENKMNADVKQVMTSNIEELDRISEIINNLLSLSALINPGKIVFQPMDLSALTREIAQKYERFADATGHHLTVHAKTPAWINGNATALSQVIGNLLKNALNYTPPGGSITVAVSVNTHDEIELYVQDTGIGIARKDLDRVFEPFYRAEQSRTRSKGGSGLGLSLTAEMVRLHNGTVSIRSTVGRGTTVTVLLPALQTQGAVEPKKASPVRV